MKNGLQLKLIDMFWINAHTLSEGTAVALYLQQLLATLAVKCTLDVLMCGRGNQQTN